MKNDNFFDVYINLYTITNDSKILFNHLCNLNFYFNSKNNHARDVNCTICVTLTEYIIPSNTIFYIKTT